MKKIKLNRNSPHVVETELGGKSTFAKDNQNNRDTACMRASQHFAETGEFTKVIRWHEGIGTCIFKRTTGDCIG